MSEENNNSPRVNQDLNDLFILASAAAPLRNLNLLDYLYANSVPFYYGGGGAGDGVHVSGIISSEDLTFVCEFGEVSGFEESTIGVEFVGFACA